MDKQRRPSPTHDFFTYGPLGLELHRVRERHTAERQRRHLATMIQWPRRRSLLLRWLGAALIHAGDRIAGDAPQPLPARGEPRS